MHPTPEQLTAAEQLATRFGCPGDYTIVDYRTPDQTHAGWRVIVLGERKGRPRSFRVSPSGDLR